jgi:cyclopropane fatty-acyl-phospholipid synthase-like methyltransferase
VFRKLKRRVRRLIVGEARLAYERRSRGEVRFFSDDDYRHELPEIFHYWSNRYLRPRFEAHGFSDPDQFFRMHLLRALQTAPGGHVEVLSLGAGDGSAEIELAGALLGASATGFRITCLDLNEALLEQGRVAARAAGLAEHLRFLRGDFNAWRPDRAYDVVVANQALHHVLELERLFDAVHEALPEHGLFLTSDVIGRNGHLRWPETLRWVRHYWQELPRDYRVRQGQTTTPDAFEDWDCSVDCFEGIRAQDVLPLLLQRFGFEQFFAFGGIVEVFVDRAFGHNFDAEGAWDRDFVDRVAQHQDALLAAGEIKPTYMLAALRRGPVARTEHWPGLAPEQAVRVPEG